MGILVEFNYKIVDGKNKKSTITLYSSTDILEDGFVNCQGAANIAMPILRNVIKGGIVGCRVSFQVYFGDLYASFPSLRIPDPASDVEEGAILYFNTENGGKWQPRIATFDEDILLSGTRIVDESNLQYQAFVESVSAGEYVEFTNSKGQEILATVLGGNENFRKRKRRRKR